MGAWSFVQPRIATATRHLNGREQRPLYFGRKPSAATATVRTPTLTLTMSMSMRMIVCLSFLLASRMPSPFYFMG